MTLTALDAAIESASESADEHGFTLKLRLGWRLYSEVCCGHWLPCFDVCTGLHTARTYRGWLFVIDDHLAQDDFIIEGIKSR